MHAWVRAQIRREECVFKESFIHEGLDANDPPSLPPTLMPAGKLEERRERRWAVS